MSEIPITRLRYDPELKKCVPVGEFDSKPRTPEVFVEPDVNLTSPSLPYHWPYAPRHDKEGKCQFTSQREIQESVAKARDHGEPVEYHRGFRHYK